MQNARIEQQAVRPPLCLRLKSYRATVTIASLPLPALELRCCVDQRGKFAAQ